ncbi:MAG: pyridoxal-phosphate dependent enzyme [Saprospiraceae bacterium]
MKTIYHKTPLLQSYQLKKEKGLNVFYKMESHQPTGSFKIRGMEYLCRHYLAKGQQKFIASSGGNAGLSMAYVAKKLGAEIQIVVPESTSEFMINKIRNLDVEVTVKGKVWDEAHEYSLREAKETNAVYVSPFDDELLWQGHASMIDECAKEMPQPTKVVLSVGGGGLLLGVLEGLRRNGWESTEVITVETFGTASFQKSIVKNELVTLPSINSIASSLGAKTVTPEALKQAKAFNVTPHLVSDEDCIRAMISFLNEYNILVEPACGASLAYPMLYNEKSTADDTILVIACGGVNTSFRQLENYKMRFLD